MIRNVWQTYEASASETCSHCCCGKVDGAGAHVTWQTYWQVFVWNSTVSQVNS